VTAGKCPPKLCLEKYTNFWAVLVTHSRGWNKEVSISIYFQEQDANKGERERGREKEWK
jgi:hypothetical protein